MSRLTDWHPYLPRLRLTPYSGVISTPREIGTPVMALTQTTALALIDLLTRAEHAYGALTDTWDNDRAARLATLATRYADRAAAITANSAPVSPAASLARDVAARAAATRRQYRVQVRHTTA